MNLHIRGPKPQYAIVGEGSSITCAIAAPTVDQTFHMLINGIPLQNVTAKDPGSKEAIFARDANFTREIYRLENGTVETAIAGFIEVFRVDHNMTEIKCLSEKYDSVISMNITLRPSNSSRL